jgi:hypothetical protein
MGTCMARKLAVKVERSGATKGHQRTTRRGILSSSSSSTRFFSSYLKVLDLNARGMCGST